MSFRYPGSSELTLRDITLEIRRGEVVAFVGMSGAGKSTLIDLVPRFHDATAGRITIDGHDVRDVTQASLRALIAVVTQETFLFSDSIHYNIAYGRAGAGADAVARAADKVLSPRQRRLLELTADGWTVPEIASELGTSAERVSDEKYKAVKKLQHYFGA